MTAKNQNLPVRSYEQRLLAVLPTVYQVDRKFGRAFAPLQVLNGVASNKTAFTVKTNDMAIVINEYDKTAIVDKEDANNRFGKLQEVIYIDTDVDYDTELSTNVLLDVTTVNNDLDAAIADQLVKTSEAYTVDMNVKDGEFFSDNAVITKNINDFQDETIEKLLNELAAAYVDLEVKVDVTAYVKPTLYNALVDSRLATTGKNSAVSIDANGIYWFKGFRIEAVPSKYFKEDDIAYLVPDGVGIPFIGISLARLETDIQYAGQILQTLSKGGRYVLEDNKKAIAKVTFTEISG